MEMESVFLDNLPDTANMILNILWDRNEEMCTAELTEAVCNLTEYLTKRTF